MTHSNGNFPTVTIGMDLGDKWSHFKVLDGSGELVGTGRVRTKREDIEKCFAPYKGARVAPTRRGSAA